MLPKGKKSLKQIAELKDPGDRVVALVTLLEYLLVGISPQPRETPRARGTGDGKLYSLLELHREKFSNYDAVDFARRVRNRLGHATGNATNTQVFRAEIDLERAVREILPYCPPQFRLDAVGPENPPVFEEGSPTSQPADPPESPLPEQVRKVPSATPMEASPCSYSTPAPPAFGSSAAKPTSLLHSPIWFGLAVLIAMGAFAYIVRPTSETSAPVTPNPLIAAPVVDDTAPKVGALPQRPLTTAVSADDHIADREQQFRTLVNTNLSLSSSQPNLALLIDSSGPEGPDSVPLSVESFIRDARLTVVSNLADVESLKRFGFFDDLYRGDGNLLRQAIQISRVDYMLLGTVVYSFRSQSNLDPDLVTCNLTLSVKLVDRAGTVVHSGNFSAAGPGFTKAQACEHAAEDASGQLKGKLLHSIRVGG